MTPPTVRCRLRGATAEITMEAGRPRNTLTHVFLADFHACLDTVEGWKEASAVVLRSAGPDFCSGMDFAEFHRTVEEGGDPGAISASYMGLLRRLATLDKVVIAAVDGPVVAGGVGLVAASDVVVAHRGVTFSLPEVIWGLVPSNVVPFLIRRMGFQPAYAMALLAQPLTAEEAYARRLVDVLADDVEAELRRLLIRTQRLRASSVAEVKGYFRRMWFSGADEEAFAVEHLRGLLARREVQDDIGRFLSHDEFPWQRRSDPAKPQ